MLKLTYKMDFKAVDDAFDELKRNARQLMEAVGKQAVDYAVANGDYRDVTGRLRASNEYEVTDEGLILRNTAPYAAEKEAEGKDVIGGAALFAESALKQACE